MFNWPFDIRTQTTFLSPKGPSFSCAPWRELSLNGVAIKLKVPRHRTKHNNESVDTKSTARLENLEFEYDEENAIKLRSALLIYRHWNFYGPWLTGYLGQISMSASVVTLDKAAEHLNYFHPRAFENVIADYLTFRYGGEFSVSGKGQAWFAPMSWQPQHQFPVLAVRFNVVANKAVYPDGLHSYLAFPISRRHILIMVCKISRAGVFTDKVPEPTTDEWIDHAPFIELTNQVLDSVQITLSPQAQAEQEEALRGLDDKSLIKDFPPLKWEKPAK